MIDLTGESPTYEPAVISRTMTGCPCGGARSAGSARAACSAAAWAATGLSVVLLCRKFPANRCAAGVLWLGVAAAGLAAIRHAHR
jgi:hypothetical protein